MTPLKVGTLEVRDGTLTEAHVHVVSPSTYDPTPAYLLHKKLK